MISLLQKPRQAEKSFPLQIDVLNYSPQDYQALATWTAFLDSIEGRMREVLDRTSPDELNSDMFDALIEAAAREACTDALRQKTEHINTIRHTQKALLGDLAEMRALRQDLDGALEEVLHQLSSLGVHTTHSKYNKEVSE